MAVSFEYLGYSVLNAFLRSFLVLLTINVCMYIYIYKCIRMIGRSKGTIFWGFTSCHISAVATFKAPTNQPTLTLQIRSCCQISNSYYLGSWKTHQAYPTEKISPNAPGAISKSKVSPFNDNSVFVSTTAWGKGPGLRNVCNFWWKLLQVGDLPWGETAQLVCLCRIKKLHESLHGSFSWALFRDDGSSWDVAILLMRVARSMDIYIYMCLHICTAIMTDRSIQLRNVWVGNPPQALRGSAKWLSQKKEVV